MTLRDFSRILHPLALLLLVSISSPAQTLKSEYLDYIKLAADEGWKEYPRVIERWKKSPNHNELWGYDAPAGLCGAIDGQMLFVVG